MKIVSQKEFGYGVFTEYRDKRYPTSWIVMQIKKALINDRLLFNKYPENFAIQLFTAVQ